MAKSMNESENMGLTEDLPALSGDSVSDENNAEATAENSLSENVMSENDAAEKASLEETEAADKEVSANTISEEGSDNIKDEVGTGEKQEEKPSFSPLPFIIGGVAFLALAAGILAAVISKKNRRKRADIMQEEPTFEPYVDGEITASSVKVILDDADSPVWIGRVHDVGKRSMQQDSFGVSDTDDMESVHKKGIMAVVADGMGGLSDGERMSQMVVITMLQGFDASTPDAVPSSTLLGLVGEANTVVNNELGPERYGKCGSTVVAVIVRDKKLSWISVGDSHIYVYRGGKLIKLNTDHNYGTQLDEMVKNGEISFDEAATDPQRAALTSFIGIGELDLIDQNEAPIGLESGDRILLMSDGIYGTVDEMALTQLLALPFRKALSALERAVTARDKKNQDNYTCVIIEVK